jgi:methyltransferase-like protein
VAYVSYNIYPGYTMFEMVRGIMLFHTRNVTEPLTQVAEARTFMNLLAEVMPDDEAYGNFIKVYTELRLTEGGEKYPGEAGLLHDELALINEPVYFYQFAQHAAAHGLQYLGEATFSSMLPDKFPAKVAEALAKLSKNIVEYEQYMDIVRNRIFRETLLCHQSAPISRRIKPEWVKDMYMASPVKPVSPEPDIAGAAVEKFQAANGATFATDHPLSKAAMLHLGQVWPQPLHFEALVAAARSVLATAAAPAQDGDSPKPGYDDAAVLAANLIKAYSYSSSLIDLTSQRPKFTLTINERPVASRLARYQAEQGRQVVANLRQQKVELDQLEHHILRYLDGNHSQADLVELTAKLVVEGEMELKQEEQPVTELAQARGILTRLIDERLHWMARVGLLEG